MAKDISIAAEITRGIRAQGSELTELDVGRELAMAWGKVQPIDVGKRVWNKSYDGLTMENNEQRDKRKGVKAPFRKPIWRVL